MAKPFVGGSFQSTAIKSSERAGESCFSSLIVKKLISWIIKRDSFVFIQIFIVNSTEISLLFNTRFMVYMNFSSRVQFFSIFFCC